jgi:Tol biopolymer transport system component
VPTSRWRASRRRPTGILVGRRFYLGGHLLGLFVISCDSTQPVEPIIDVASIAASGSTLNPPSDAKAAAVSGYVIDVSWRDNSTNETGFELHRSTTGASGAFELRALNGASVVTFSDAGLTPSTPYCYRVRAFRKTGNKTSYSAFSTTICAMTLEPPPPPPPSELAVVARTVGVDLDADGYEIFVMEDGGGRHSASLPANGTVTLSDVRHGTVTLDLSGDAPNCYLTTPSSQVISYQASTTVAYELTCGRITPIAYASTIDGNAEIYSVNSTSTGNAMRLTFHPAADREPAWSPDGSRIAFRSERDGNAEIYVMSADGSSPIRLTSDPAQDESPAWSQDGARIAFVSDRDSESKIYVMNTDGGDVSATNQPGSAPAWSPDGQRLAFAWGPIYLMNPDGTGVSRLTNPFNDGVQGHMYEYDTSPAWSPDGTTILFDRTSCDGLGFGCIEQVMRVSATGSTDEFVTFYSSYRGTYQGGPAWSPEGRKIAFEERDSIVVIRTDGTHGTWLAPGFAPAWRR